MKKQELIHLHGLLSEVRSEYEEWGTDIDLTEYQELGVKPTSIHRSKTDHKAAVFKLASGITSSADTGSTETVAPNAD
ncbi:UPF0058 family protein [Halobaculum lipolyticum]|uniref:UPF0058 family protein n=1 Tax=Halobaculum lipolyticum TaxID=3032001 RepID=A0ABD5WE01_9EURY|nr:UPF0058 family protein [Halobaculum sp. DT31]